MSEQHSGAGVRQYSGNYCSQRQFTDSSSDILEEYANWGEVRRVELTKETGGSAAKARNAGILQAKGEYLLFVDCDDVLLPGAISALLQKAQQTGADIVQGGWQYLDGDGKFGAAQRFAEHIYEKRTAYDCLDLPGTPWAKLTVGACLMRSGFRQDIPALRMRSSIF